MLSEFSVTATMSNRDEEIAAIDAVRQGSEDASIAAAALRALQACGEGTLGLTVSRGSDGATPAHDVLTISVDLGELA